MAALYFDILQRPMEGIDWRAIAIHEQLATRFLQAQRFSVAIAGDDEPASGPWH
jgi:hypothetical protein